MGRPIVAQSTGYAKNYAYDKAGNMTKNTITYCYDKSGSPVEKAFGKMTDAYAYDAPGHVES